jgi:hypothetical protein
MMNSCSVRPHSKGFNMSDTPSKKPLTKQTKALVAVAAGVAAAAAVMLDVPQDNVQQVINVVLSWFVP